MQVHRHAGVGIYYFRDHMQADDRVINIPDMGLWREYDTRERLDVVCGGCCPNERVEGLFCLRPRTILMRDWRIGYRSSIMYMGLSNMYSWQTTVL